MTVTTERDLTRAAEDLRGFLQDPRKLWQIRSDPEQAILQGARVHVGADIVDHYFGVPVILAAAMTESALKAALAPDGSVCRWCHALQRAGQDGTRVPVSQASLAVLGQPCGVCANYVMAEVHARLDEMLADPEPEPVVAAATMPVRDAISLAYRLRREREAANLALVAAAAADGDPVAQAKLDRHHAARAAAAGAGDGGAG